MVLSGPALGQDYVSAHDRQSDQNKTTQQPDDKAADQADAKVPNDDGAAGLIGSAETWHSSHDRNIKNTKNTDVGQPKQAIEEVWFWGDSPAQWAMTLISAIAAGISGIAVYFLVKTLEATRAAVDEAKAATKVAQDTVKITERTAKAQLRAYISPEKVSFYTHHEEWLSVGVVLKNVGQTPANEIASKLECAIIPTQKVSNYQFPIDDLSPLGTLGPSQVVTIRFIQPNGNDFADCSAGIEQNRQTFVVWGAVRYVDVFGDEQATTFRYKYSIFSDDFTPLEQGNKST
ncbi:MAG: hypothetical protein P1V34_14365 [Alphaproteobacteria bacterium]|nr:hypothetical protein [Alphaproteobacteria bacterium]